MPSGIQIPYAGIKNVVRIDKLNYDINYIREFIAQKMPEFRELSSSSNLVSTTMDTQEFLDLAEVSNHFKSLNDSFFAKVNFKLFVILR